MDLTTFVGKGMETKILNYQQGTLLFCFFIGLAIFILLPKKVSKSKRVAASLLIFIGLYGLFSMLIKSMIGLIG
ncbi:hypothetical protein KY331_03790 [Candidatus Woesearchaeota archaeon]|nr:hypothetical protein [Candidatus Woesearchaeota archaeon]